MLSIIPTGAQRAAAELVFAERAPRSRSRAPSKWRQRKFAHDCRVDHKLPPTRDADGGLKDIAPSLTRYEALGLQRIESGSAGCVGMQAGTAAVIFASVGFMNGDYDSGHIAHLEGETMQYVHVSSVEEVRS